MIKLKWLPLLLAFVFAPAMARADGIIDWIEKMSGPGPWKGGGAYAQICVDKDSRVTFLCFHKLESHRPEGERHILELGVARYGTLDNRPRFDDTPGDTRGITVWRIDPRYYYRFHKALDAGIGAGFWRFNGESTGDFDPFWIATFTPVTVVLTPLAFLQKDSGQVNGWLRVFKLTLEESLVTGLDGGKFKSSTKYTSGKELVGRYGIRFDFLEVKRK